MGANLDRKLDDICDQPILDIRDLDWSAKRTWFFKREVHWYCNHHVKTLRASAYLYGRTTGRQVHSYFKYTNGKRSHLVIAFHGIRKGFRK